MAPPKTPPSSSSGESADSDEEEVNTQTNQPKPIEEEGSSSDEEDEAPKPEPVTKAAPESSDSDDEETTPQTKTTTNRVDDEADDDEDDDDDDSSTEEDEESEPKPEPAQLVTPISSRPIEEPKSSSSKPPPQPQRIFTTDDDIVILKGLHKYKEEYGTAKTIIAKIRPFVEKSLSVEVTDTKLYEKIRRLKEKYAARLSKEEGEKFSSEHDMVVFELSKNVWGDLEVSGESSRKRKKWMKKKKDEEGRKMARMELGREKGGGGEYRFLSEELERLRGLVVVGVEEGVEKDKAREVEEIIKNVRLAEVRYEAERMGLLKESLELVMDGLERSGM